MPHNLHIAAIDLDDTLVRNDWTISERALTAIARWRVERGRVVIATGRPPRWTRKIPNVLHDTPWVCYNGALAFENGEEIYRNMLPAETVRRLLDLFARELPESRIGLEVDDLLHVNRLVESDEAREDVRLAEDLLTLADQPTAKILLTSEHFHALRDQIEAISDGAGFLVSSKVSMVQMMAPNASKAMALRELAARWGWGMENVVAFGDDINDVEMVREAGLGVAVENAVSEVKAVADRVAPSNDEDGVAAVLEELLAA